MIRTQEILITKGKEGLYQKLAKSRSGGQNYADVFIYEPANAEELVLGNLYFAAELTNVSTDSSHLINLLISAAKREYYSHPEIGCLTSFENGLKKINIIISDLVHGTDAKKNIECLAKLNCLCATACHDTIHFTKIGHFKLLLHRDGSIVDIGKKINTATEKNQLKNFKNVISGKLENGDRLLFSSARALDLLDEEQLHKIFDSPLSASQDLVTGLVKRKKEFSPPLAMLLMEIVENEPLKENHINEENKKEYITPPIYLGEIWQP